MERAHLPTFLQRFYMLVVLVRTNWVIKKIKNEAFPSLSSQALSSPGHAYFRATVLAIWYNVAASLTQKQKAKPCVLWGGQTAQWEQQKVHCVSYKLNFFLSKQTWKVEKNLITSTTLLFCCGNVYIYNNVNSQVEVITWHISKLLAKVSLHALV